MRALPTDLRKQLESAVLRGPACGGGGGTGGADVVGSPERREARRIWTMSRRGSGGGSRAKQRQLGGELRGAGVGCGLRAVASAAVRPVPGGERAAAGTRSSMRR